MSVNELEVVSWSSKLVQGKCDLAGIFRCRIMNCFPFFSMGLVEVIGKQNKEVPVLVPPAVKRRIDAMVKYREENEMLKDNKYMFATVSKLIRLYHTVSFHQNSG